MVPLALGLAVLLMLVLLGRGYISSDVKKLAHSLRFAAGVALAIGAAGLAITGRFGPALLIAGAAWALLMGQGLPWPLGQARMGGGGNAPGSSRMSRAEALSVLGLNEGVSDEEIIAAHRRLIRQTHPDAGGSNYLAAKINEAKDVLLRK